MAADNSDYNYVEAGTVDIKDLPPLEKETEKIMKTELSTGLKLSSIYYVFIFAIPILNWFNPDFMFSRFWGGMTYAWFLTGIVAMAMAFIIGYTHTTLYEKRLAKMESSNTSESIDGRNIG